MRIREYDFVPYVLGAEAVGGAARKIAALPGTLFLDVLSDENEPFFRRLQAANALAFAGMAMPAWVQLDCATLPSAMIGFALRRGDLPEELALRFRPKAAEGAERAAPEDLFPVSAFCAVHTAEPGRVVAFTLFSLMSGLELGLRSKAMGLLVLGAQRQVGVTRRTGPVRALHERIGPVRVLKDAPRVHPQAEKTMVYELDVPPAQVLRELALRGSRGAQGGVESAS